MTTLGFSRVQGSSDGVASATAAPALAESTPVVGLEEVTASFSNSVGEATASISNVIRAGGNHVQRAMSATTEAVAPAVETVSSVGLFVASASKSAIVDVSSSISSTVASPVINTVGEVKSELFSALGVWGTPARSGIDGHFMDDGSPAEANFWERTRDAWLRFLLRLSKTLMIVAILASVVLVVFAGFIVVCFLALNLGVKYGGFSEDDNPRCNLSLYNTTENPSIILFPGDLQYPPRTNLTGVKGRLGEEIGMGGYVAYHCTQTQRWFNICIKYFTFYFTYINCLPLPWTLSVFMHAWFPPARRGWERGVDFYGRPTKSLWFHLTLRWQRWVSSLLLFAFFVQIPDAASHVMFWSYLSIQTWPGVLVTNIWLALQVSSQIAASVLLSRAENEVRTQSPGKFPPAFTSYIREAYKTWREMHRGEHVHRCGLPICCGKDSFYTFVMDELKVFEQDQKKYGSHVAPLTGIDMATADDRRDSAKSSHQA